MSFFLSKFFWILAAPLHLFALLLLIAGIASWRGKLWGRRLVLIFSVALVLMIGVPLGDFLLAPLENRFPRDIPEKVDGIILLAGDESPALAQARDYPALGETAERYIAFATLARRYPEAQLVFTGGTGSLRPRAERISFGEIARRALEGLGVAPDRVIFESESRNTYENAQASAAMTSRVLAAMTPRALAVITPQASAEGEDRGGRSPSSSTLSISSGTWLLVTSAYHMPRAMGCFRRAGWRVFPAPTDYKSTGFSESFPRFNLVRNLNYTTIALREYVGLAAYWAMGRISEVWP